MNGLIVYFELTVLFVETDIFPVQFSFFFFVENKQIFHRIEENEKKKKTNKNNRIIHISYVFRFLRLLMVGALSFSYTFSFSCRFRLIYTTEVTKRRQKTSYFTSLFGGDSVSGKYCAKKF